MHSNAPASAPGARAIVRLPLREARLFWEFTWRDWSTTLVPTTVFALAALKTRWPVSRETAALALARCLAYFALYIYTFCLANQVAGVEEDCVNKPGRPIPRGLVSRRGALARWKMGTIAFLMVGAWLGVFVWALGWVVLTVLVCFCGWDRHWFTKNVIVMAGGVLVELAATWQLVSPLTPAAWRWVLVLSATIGVTSLLQDMRDVAGDRAVGRWTLPVALGESAARWSLAALFTLAPFAVHFGLMPHGGGAKVIACDVALGAWSLAIAARILRDRTPRAAHATYMFYTYWYCALLSSAVIVL